VRKHVDWSGGVDVETGRVGRVEDDLRDGQVGGEVDLVQTDVHVIGDSTEFGGRRYLDR